MKFTVKLAALAALGLVLAGGASAQQDEPYAHVPYRVAIALDGGIGFPSAPSVFSDLWNETLPFQVSVTYAPLQWLHIGGLFAYASWGISENPAKQAIGFVGTEAVTGGGIRTLFYGGLIRAIPFPKLRLIPFVEVGGGRFSVTADDLTIENRLTNRMGNVSGPSFFGGGGLQYAMNEHWNVYTKFTWTVGSSSTFSPGNLVRRAGDPEVPGESLQFGTLSLGIYLKL